MYSGYMHQWTQCLWGSYCVQNAIAPWAFMNTTVIHVIVQSLIHSDIVLAIAVSWNCGLRLMSPTVDWKRIRLVFTRTCSALSGHLTAIVNLIFVAVAVEVLWTTITALTVTTKIRMTQASILITITTSRSIEAGEKLWTRVVGQRMR